MNLVCFFLRELPVSMRSAFGSLFRWKVFQVSLVCYFNSCGQQLSQAICNVHEYVSIYALVSMWSTHSLLIIYFVPSMINDKVERVTNASSRRSQISNDCEL